MHPRMLATITIVGSSLNVLGTLYLAYDLLGGEHGPLRTLTRAVSYGMIFGLGYGIVLGPAFGIASGAAHGITLGWEYSRAARHKPQPGWWNDIAASAIRGLGYGLGAAYSFGAIFAMVFAVLSTVGQVFAYRLGIRPTMDYLPATRPRLTKRQLWAAVNRMAGYAIAGYASAAVAHQTARAVALGLKVGLTVGAVTAIASACVPFIEWGTDHMPQKRMGVTGVILILIGFVLQSVQYWEALMDLNHR